ncbi:MAG: hypothetical protein J5930_10735 [Treponema sp.]|nr:hypothetical protein [Treponema sp.]
MAGKFTEDSGRFLSALGKIILLAAVCAVLGFGIVWPLWKWATVSAKSYTVAVLSVCALGVLWILIRSFRKVGAFRFFIRVGKIISVALGIFFAVYFVLKSQRILGAVVLIVSFAVCYLISLGGKKHGVK